MALLIFAFVKNGYLLRLASTLQQNWPHSFRKMSFDVWRIFLYFSSNKHISMFCQQWWDLFGTFIVPCGRYEVCSDITIFMELVEGEAEHVTTQKYEGKLTNKG